MRGQGYSWGYLRVLVPLGSFFLWGGGGGLEGFIA